MKFKQILLTEKEQLIYDRTVQTAKTYEKCEGDLIELIEEFDRIRMFEKFGEASTFKFCVNVLNFTHSVSYTFQAIARKTRTVPELLKAVRDGLSIWTASKLVSQITPENQKVWIDKAFTLTQLELERELAAANPKKRKKTVKIPIDRDYTRMAVDIPNDTLTLLIRAQEISSDDEAKILHDALEMYLDKKDPVRKAERSRMRNSAQAEVFTREPAGIRIPLSAKTLAAVNGRDRGQCQAILPNGKKCCAERFPQIHHVVEVANGGTNDVENLVTLCSSHHRIHHKFSTVRDRVVEYVAYSA